MDISISPLCQRLIHEALVVCKDWGKIIPNSPKLIGLSTPKNLDGNPAAFADNLTALYAALTDKTNAGNLVHHLATIPLSPDPSASRNPFPVAHMQMMFGGGLVHKGSKADEILGRAGVLIEGATHVDDSGPRELHEMVTIALMHADTSTGTFSVDDEELIEYSSFPATLFEATWQGHSPPSAYSWDEIRLTATSLTIDKTKKIGSGKPAVQVTGVEQSNVVLSGQVWTTDEDRSGRSRTYKILKRELGPNRSKGLASMSGRYQLPATTQETEHIDQAHAKIVGALFV